MNERTRLRRLAATAAAALGFSGARVRLLHDGYNVTYRVDVGGERYALRVTRPGPTLAHVRAELVWVAALAGDTGLRLASPVGCVEVGGRVCVLNRWVTGAQRGRGLTPNMLAAVGRVMARMHDQAEGWTPPGGWSRPVLDEVWMGAPSPLDALEPRTRAAFAEAAERLAPLLKRLVAQQAFVLHADLHQGNYRFDPGLAVGVLDFDDCALGHPAQDIAITAYYLQRFPHYAALSDALRRGYCELRRWPTDPEIHEALLIWRVLSLCAHLNAHASESFRGLLTEILPRWTEDVEGWLRA